MDVDISEMSEVENFLSDLSEVEIMEETEWSRGGNYLVEGNHVYPNANDGNGNPTCGKRNLHVVLMLIKPHLSKKKPNIVALCV